MRRHLTYANVMATIAVFLALGGGAAFAATQVLPKNSVGSAQLKKNAVTGRAIRDGSIKGADVSEASLGKVPSAARADSATTAASATNAVHATSADSATRATTAATATSAATATTAATAGTAASATTAGNAGTVGGLSAAQLKLRCPAGTRPEWGMCLELAASGQAAPLDALADCSSRGGRLPTWLELTWVRQQADIVWAAGTGNNQYELTGEASDPSAGNQTVIAIERSGNVDPAGPATTNFHYRCVLAQVNG
jgi:hypothetical protein